MNFVLQTPNLQHLVSVKVVTKTWNDILTQIRLQFNGKPRYALREEAEEWKEMEENVKSKVSALLVPQTCKELLFNLIKPMGVEVICYCRYHSTENNMFEVIDISLINQLCWTMRGTVDYRKTAELILKDQSMDVIKRYELACLNCLEDEARSLMQLLPLDRRLRYLNGTMFFTRTEHCDWMTFFTCTLSGDASGLNRYFLTRLRGSSIHKYLFEATLSTGNRARCEYLFQKLKQGEKDQVFEIWLHPMQINFYEYSGAFGLLHYLSRMSEEQLGLVLQRCVSDLLVCLLRWPMQSLFMEAAKRGWSFLTIGNCKEVLRAILRKLCNGFKDYDYSRLFRECWGLCSVEYKHYFMNDFACLIFLIETKEEDCIKLALFNLYKFEIMHEFYIETTLDLLLDERVISDAVLMVFKDEAASNCSNNDQDEEKKLSSQYVLQFVDLVIEKRRIQRREI